MYIMYIISYILLKSKKIVIILNIISFSLTLFLCQEILTAFLVFRRIFPVRKISLRNLYARRNTRLNENRAIKYISTR